MKLNTAIAFLSGAGLTALVLTRCAAPSAAPPASGSANGPATGAPAANPETTKGPDAPAARTPAVAAPRPIAPFIDRGIEWLVRAQHQDGGWGAGSHARQDVRDPHQVVTDPATTAFAAMALLRAGHKPFAGEYRDPVRRATEYLVAVVELAPAAGARITTLTGTQPQAKMGDMVDTSLTLQFLTRVLPAVAESPPLQRRVDAAIAKCLDKLEGAQEGGGGWGGGGWAGVLQSSLNCTALELADAAGKSVDQAKLAVARTHQKRNYDRQNQTASAPDAAGVELYAFAGAQKAAASEARAAEDVVRAAKSEGRIAADAEVCEETLIAAGLAGDKSRVLAQSFAQNSSQMERLEDAQLLAGFGNNGGEEYLSYLMTSESLLVAGGAEWEKWNDKMLSQLERIQSPDGSWTGHHCITSPAFCTAAAVQCLTTDRDAELLLEVSARAVAGK